MSNPSFEEHFGMIVRCEPYFEPDDHTQRMEIDFIKGSKTIHLQGSTTEFEVLVDFLNREIDRANDRTYIP